MFKHAIPLTAAAVVLAASNVANVYAQHKIDAAAQSAEPQAGAHVTAMSDVERAAQRLREAIQVMAQQAPGPDRDHAIHEAKKALISAQEAMVRFGPPAPKTLPPRQSVAAGPQSFDEAAHKLTQASDRLYDAVHTMARAPAGERRNGAIAEVNRALFDTQDAMAWAADKKFSSAVGGTSAYAGGSVGTSQQR